MNWDNTDLGIHFGDIHLSLSARRIREHIEFRQISPFGSIPTRGRIRPEAYVDIVDASSLNVILTDLTLADVLEGKSRGLDPFRVRRLIRHVESHSTQVWLTRVKLILQSFSSRRSVRNAPAAFLPRDHNSPVGVAGLRCALRDWLDQRRSETNKAEQWLQRIRNLGTKGMREEEFAFCGIAEALAGHRGSTIDGGTVLQSLTYEGLRLSILPVVRFAGRHVQFAGITAGAANRRIKPKLKNALELVPQWHEPVLGYWIDTVEWADLLGRQRGWLAFTHRGEALRSTAHPLGLCQTPEQAATLADNDAAENFPRLSTQGRWSRFRPTGGEQYREWLVTLPCHTAFYQSSHFDHRNVLLHVRCDIRVTDDDERVLVLQEVQSDWARSATQPEIDGVGPVSVPPWLQEWPLLALKLVLLHAAHNGLDAVAWTSAEMQSDRYDGAVGQVVTNLYSRVLPNELNRLLRSYSRRTEEIDVFLPVNFSIEPDDSGYVVFDENGERLGRASTWHSVPDLLPDGAHEMLASLHGVRLDAVLRRQILDDGFFAWGYGIR